MKSPDAEEVETTIEEDLAAAMKEHVEPADDTPPPADDTPPAADDAPPADDTPPADEAPVVPDRYGVAPQYAKKAVRESWKDFPPEVRKELHDREAETHQQFTRFDEERQFGKRVLDVVKPYEGFIKSLGAEPVQAFDYLLKTDYALRTAPPEQRKAMFLKAARDYGIQFGENEIVTPQHNPQLETLQQRLDRLEQERSRDIEERQLADRRSIDQQIADFSSRPENVYFDKVSPVMASLLSSGQADSLEQAYEMAVFADPETRALQLAAQSQAEESKRKSQNNAQVANARRASASVTGAPGLAVPTQAPNSATSLEDDIRHAIQAASGRV